MTDRLPTAPDADPLERSVRRAVDGEFAIIRELGRGGMGVVYLARDLRLDREVALKVLPLEQGRDPVSRERFLREARTAAQLAHPNIVPVYRADERDELALFVMAYVEGESLGDRLRARGALAPHDAVRILRDAALALAYAHGRGVVHRDVKPENILIDRVTGRALVTDFGIARRTGAGDSAPGLTQPHAIMGTLHYMSPEQVSGAPLDGRSDLYALGVVAFEALAGRVPFADVTGTAVLVAHASRPAPPLASVAPHVPAALAAVVDRALAKDPAARYATGDAFAEALAVALPSSAAARGADAPLGAALPATISEREAEAIWKRAAQLQADAARRLEERRDLLTRALERPANAHADSPVADRDDARATGGYALRQVMEAAREAGISDQYVAMAVAELPRADAGLPARRADTELGISERQATRFLGTQERSLAVSLIIPATPARTLRALGAVLCRSPFDLQLRETVGGHPLDGGVIVLDLPGSVIGAGAGVASMLNTRWMATRQQLEARQLQVTLRALPGDAARTEVTMTTDLRPGVRRNVRVSQWIAGISGVVSGGFGVGTSAVAIKAGAALSLAGGAAIAAAATLGVGALAIWGYRRLYVSVLGTAQQEMRGALAAVASALQSEEVFGELPPGGRPTPGPSADQQVIQALLMMG